LHGWKLVQFEQAVHRQAVYLLRLDREMWHSGLVNEAEQAAARGDTRSLYAIVSRLSPGAPKPMAGVYNDKGRPCHTEEEEIHVWQQHLSKLVLATPLPEHCAPAMGEVCTPLTVKAGWLGVQGGLPTLEEMAQSLRRAKLMKGYPSWSLPTEAWRLLGVEGLRALRATHKAGLIQGRWPRKWATSQAIFLNKPGKDPGPADNYREIQLMDTAAKICTGAYAGKEAQFMLNYLTPGE